MKTKVLLLEMTAHHLATRLDFTATPQGRVTKTREKCKLIPAKGTQITALRLTTLNATFLLCLLLQCQYTEHSSDPSVNSF